VYVIGNCYRRNTQCLSIEFVVATFPPILHFPPKSITKFLLLISRPLNLEEGPNLEVGVFKLLSFILRAKYARAKLDAATHGVGISRGGDTFVLLVSFPIIYSFEVY
jgi:hypothetical protein